MWQLYPQMHQFLKSGWSWSQKKTFPAASWLGVHSSHHFVLASLQHPQVCWGSPLSGDNFQGWYQNWQIKIHNIWNYKQRPKVSRVLPCPVIKIGTKVYSLAVFWSDKKTSNKNDILQGENGSVLIEKTEMRKEVKIAKQKYRLKWKVAPRHTQGCIECQLT